MVNIVSGYDYNPMLVTLTVKGNILGNKHLFKMFQNRPESLFLLMLPTAANVNWFINCFTAYNTDVQRLTSTKIATTD